MSNKTWKRSELGEISVGKRNQVYAERAIFGNGKSPGTKLSCAIVKAERDKPIISTCCSKQYTGSHEAHRVSDSPRILTLLAMNRPPNCTHATDVQPHRFSSVHIDLLAVMPNNRLVTVPVSNLDTSICSSLYTIKI